MKILFICSGKNSSRSLIAKAVMESFDNMLDVYAANVDLVTEVNPLALEALSSIGLTIGKEQIYSLQDCRLIEFDYVITVCEGTREEFYSLSLNYKRKLHLGFSDPEKAEGEYEVKLQAYHIYLEEMKIELDYFYNHILKPKATH